MSLANGNGKQNWTAVTKSAPCPVCGKDHNCKVSLDGGAVYCGDRESDHPKGPNGGGQWLHILVDGKGPAGFVHPSHLKPPKPKPVRDWGPVADQLSGCDQSHIEDLAKTLGVEAWSLGDLPTGFGSADGRSSAWTFPERNEDGQLLGISKRLLVRRKDGTNKEFVAGGSRGLIYPEAWHEPGGPILLVEGPTDTAAIWSMGLSVIGRPNNRGGVDLLAKMLAETTREIIVVAEYDLKPDGRWPGREGAIATAQRLADRLCRAVDWALPGDDEKDSRAWLNSFDHWVPGRARGELFDLGQRYLAGLQLNHIEPKTGPPEPYAAPTLQIVPLDDWRKEASDARIESIGKPGLYVDDGPTGSGKNHADRAAIRKVERSLIIVPTHPNCRELETELRDDGIDATAYPELTEDLCQNINEAEQAQSMGLSPGATVCIGCVYRKNCGFIEQGKKAKESPVLIICHKRAAKQFVTLAEGRQYAAVHENAEDLIRPTLEVWPDDLGRVAEVCSEARHREQDRREPDLELIDGLALMENNATDLENSAKVATETGRPKTLPRSMEPPAQWELKVWRAVHAVIDSKRRKQLPDQAAMQLIAGLAFGAVRNLAFQIDHPGGSDEPRVQLIGTEQTTLPGHLPIWFCDATGRAELLGDLAGQVVHDKTPAGSLANQKSVLQIDWDLTRSGFTHPDPKRKAAAADTAAGMLMGILAAHPEAERVGLISHRPVIEELFSKRSPLDEQNRDRIHRKEYFGGKLMRGSNNWQECDLLIVLGTPRVNPGSIKTRLIRAGKMTAAADPNEGTWGKRRWVGRSTDGTKRVIEGLGYADPTWRQAHEDIVRAALIQALGRARSILESGLPAIAVTTEPLGLDLVEPGKITQITKKVREAIQVVRRCCDSAIQNYIDKTQQPTGTQTARVAAEMGINPSGASRHLQVAERSGLIRRHPSRKGGWMPVPSREHTIREAPADPQKIPRPPAPPARPPAKQYRAAELAAAIPGCSIAADLEPADTS